MIHNGSDIRWWPAFHLLKNLHADSQSYCTTFEDLNNKRLKVCMRNIRYSEKYANLILATPDANLFGIRKYMHFYYPFEVNVKPISKSNKKLLVVHSPSHKLAKGTYHIESAIAALKFKGLDFDYLRIDNMSNNEVLEILTKADILIEQVGQIIYGKNAVEGMANGCITLSEISPNFINRLIDCPIVSINSTNIETILSDVILSPNKYKQNITNGYTYVSKYHTSVSVVKMWIDNVDEIKDSHMFYTPKFFSQCLEYYPELKKEGLKI
jgi:hypothetical protein